MATMLAERIVENLIATSVVEEVDRELYVYGFFLLITRFFFFLVTVIFGCLLGIPFESVIFYIVFILLRSYAGGVHAKTEVACTIWTTVAMGSTVTTIKMLKNLNVPILPFFVLGNICILTFSPLESREKLLDFVEKRKYRKICYWQLFIYDGIIVVAILLSFKTLCYSVLCGILLEAILLSVGKYFCWVSRRHI